MPTAPTTVAQYLAGLPAERRAVIAGVRKLVRAHMPKGYSEFINWGVITWGIPLSEYPDTYNGQPLCYAALAAKKNHSALYLMGCYGSPTLTAYLRDAYKQAGKKFDMGKSCLRFRSMDELVPEAVGHVIAAVPVKTYLEFYESVHKPKSQGRQKPSKGRLKKPRKKTRQP